MLKNDIFLNDERKLPNRKSIDFGCRMKMDVKSKFPTRQLTNNINIRTTIN